jgi:hypothetical protein
MRLRWLAILLAHGCGVTFPSETIVEDLRILEISVSPPEISVFEEVRVDAELEDLASLTPNLEPVRLTALAAHPDLDATFDVEWIRCKDGNGTGFLRVPCGGEFKERIGTGTSTTVRPIELIFEDLATLEGGPADAIGSLTRNPSDLFTGQRLFMNAQVTVASAAVEADTARLEGTKRLLLFDPTIVALVLREARRRGPDALPMIEGVEVPTLCTNVGEEEFAMILEYLRTRTPNRSPQYASVEYTLPTSTTTAIWTEGDAPLEIGPNDAITFRGLAAPGAKESYRVIDNKCRLTDFTETLVWSWFTNVGDFSDQLTSEGETPMEEDFETTYRAPPADELEADRTRARVWSVLRDGRGGSDNVVIDLVISKPG